MSNQLIFSKFVYPKTNLMNPFDIINKYYTKGSDLYNILVDHSTDVKNKALSIARNHPEFGADETFIEEAAMLHDIGIFLTDAPSIQCFGKEPYIRHGILGAEILRNEGLSKHALVCERHTGAGLTKEEIMQQALPLPLEDMMPISIEEQIICFADCFFSKTKLGQEKTVEKIISKMAEHNARSAQQIEEWRIKLL